MKHCGTQRIETQRLILRRFTVDDAEAMFRNWASDEQVVRYLMWPAHSSADVSGMILKEWVAAYSDEKNYQWAIVLRELGEPIGSIAAVSMNDSVGSAHIGYCIGSRWWHRGIMTEALSAVIDFFFDTVDAARVESRHDPRNPNSGKVMEKCGMKYEGTLRQSDRNNQGICDARYYGLLKAERE